MRLFPCGLWYVIAFDLIPAQWSSGWKVWLMNLGPLLYIMLRGHGYPDNPIFEAEHIWKMFLLKRS